VLLCVCVCVCVVKDEAMFFHGGEDGVELSVVDDAGGGVGGYACRIGLDASDASGFRLFNR
jgi:hypothetical protein